MDDPLGGVSFDYYANDPAVLIPILMDDPLGAYMESTSVEILCLNPYSNG